MKRKKIRIKRTNIPRKIDPDEVRERRNQKEEERRGRSGGSRRKMEEGETVEMREWREWSVGEEEKSTTSLTQDDSMRHVRSLRWPRSTVRAHERHERCYRPPSGSGLLQTTHRQNNKHGMRHTRPSIHPSLHSFVSILQIPSKIRSPVDTAAGHRRYYYILIPYCCLVME